MPKVLNKKKKHRRGKLNRQYLETMYANIFLIISSF